VGEENLAIVYKSLDECLILVASIDVSNIRASGDVVISHKHPRRIKMQHGNDGQHARVQNGVDQIVVRDALLVHGRAG